MSYLKRTRLIPETPGFDTTRRRPLHRDHDLRERQRFWLHSARSRRATLNSRRRHSRPLSFSSTHSIGLALRHAASSAYAQLKAEGTMKKNAGAALLRTALLGCLAIAGTALIASASPTGGLHGAMVMDAQQQRLDRLVTDAAGAPRAWTHWLGQKSTCRLGNEPTADRIALGRKLYFDTRLSKDGTVACATCHDVSRGFTDHRNVSEGIGDHLGRRSAPHDHERCAVPEHVLGRPGAQPGGTGQAADPQSGRDGPSGRGQRP